MLSSRMRVVVAAVGRLKQGPERELAERYRKRAADAGRSAGLKRHRHRRDQGEPRQRHRQAHARRIDRLANLIPDRAATVSWTSAARHRAALPSPDCCSAGATQDRPAVVFIIGGAGRPGARPARKGEPRHCLRRRDLAAPAGANHAAGAALSRRDDPRRAPLPSRVRGRFSCTWNPRQRDRDPDGAIGMRCRAFAPFSLNPVPIFAMYAALEPFCILEPFCMSGRCSCRRSRRSPPGDPGGDRQFCRSGFVASAQTPRPRRSPRPKRTAAAVPPAASMPSKSATRSSKPARRAAAGA